MEQRCGRMRSENVVASLGFAMDMVEIILQSRTVNWNMRHPKNFGQLVKYVSGTLRCFENLWSRIELAAKTNGVSYILDNSNHGKDGLRYKNRRERRTLFQIFTLSSIIFRT